MKEMGCMADVVIGAACTLLYSTRIQKNGKVYIFGIKNAVRSLHCPQPTTRGSLRQSAT